MLVIIMAVALVPWMYTECRVHVSFSIAGSPGAFSGSLYTACQEVIVELSWIEMVEKADEVTENEERFVHI